MHCLCKDTHRCSEGGKGFCANRARWPVAAIPVLLPAPERGVHGVEHADDHETVVAVGRALQLATLALEFGCG